MTEVAGVCGVVAWTKVKPVTLEVIKICIEVRPQIEKMKEDNWKIYIPVVYSQIVKGMNYVVKVLVDEHGDGVCVHAMIKLPCNGGELSVTGIQFHKKFDDPLIHF
ncbi:hypothetical protein cypCar_00042702 [Cyprinus carpio]|uniref:Cystatin domain-containing protein n=1 Tax=Cyprinus carpio carpio TaxID=630221 RepID=A0A9J7Y1V9_CYPCA|nr:hypothetical protein cypCar_00042702 [Cyprinus carpio]